MIRGTTNIFNITVLDIDGDPYTLLSGEKLIFGVKRKYTDEEYIFIKTIEAGSADIVDGVYKIMITPQDTNECRWGDYMYDVSIQSGDNFYNIISPSRFTIEKNITKWGDGV